MGRRLAVLVLVAVGLVGCGPQISAQRDGVAARVISVTNKDSRHFTIDHIVANDKVSDSSCTDRPSASVATLAPGESYTTTFFVCGPVDRITVYTDAGSASFSW